MDKENKEKITKDDLTTGTTIFFKENQLGEGMPTALIPSVFNYVCVNNCINVYRIDTNTFENIPLERIFSIANPIKLNNPSNKKFHLGEIVKFKGNDKKFVVTQASSVNDINDMVCIYEIEVGTNISNDISLCVKQDLLEHVEPTHVIDWDNEEFSKAFKDNPKKSYRDYRFGINIRVLDSYDNLGKYKIIIVHNMAWFNIKICRDERYTDSLLSETMLTLFNPYESFMLRDENPIKENYCKYMEERGIKKHIYEEVWFLKKTNK